MTNIIISIILLKSLTYFYWTKNIFSFLAQVEKKTIKINMIAPDPYSITVIIKRTFAVITRKCKFYAKSGLFNLLFLF